MSLPGRRLLLVLMTLVAIAGLGLSLWYVMTPKLDPSQADRLVQQTRWALRARRISEADSLLDQLASIRRPTSDDQILIAELEAAKHQEDVALARLKTISDSDPAAPRARVLAGQIETGRHRLVPAENAFLDALKLDPDLDSARRGLIYIYGMQSRRPELDAQFQILARDGDLKFQDMLVWTLSLEDIWVNSGVQADLEKFVAADPDDRASRLALADVLLRTGQLEASESALQPLPDSDPDALAIRARLAWNRSDLMAVETLLAKAPNDHAGLARLRGQFLIRKDRPDEAAEAFRVALRSEPSNQEALQGLALALRRTGAGQEAEESARKAERQRDLTSLLELCRSEKTRDDPTLPIRLATTCETIGRDDMALGWYRAALARDPTDPTLQKAIHRLRQKRRE